VLLMKEEIQKRGVQVEWDFAAPLLSVEMDRPQVEQVFVNIFKNALEAME
jgi:C4-dicarboxylate-specific signal transduction histidine kinase